MKLLPILRQMKNPQHFPAVFTEVWWLLFWIATVQGSAAAFACVAENIDLENTETIPVRCVTVH